MKQFCKNTFSTLLYVFVDFQKAIDSKSHTATCVVLQPYGVGTWLIDLLNNTNENAQAAVRINNELGNGLMSEKGPGKEIQIHLTCS